MARKDALLRLHSRLVARRDALRKALSGDMEGFRQFAAMNDVGDNVDAAVDTANDEISSQLVEIESRELGHRRQTFEPRRVGADADEDQEQDEQRERWWRRAPQALGRLDDELLRPLSLDADAAIPWPPAREGHAGRLVTACTLAG